MEELTIGRLAREADVHVETIRYYQRRGLLAEPKRPAGGIRRYGNEAVARLGFIRRAQELGFSLEEVKTLLVLAETPNCRGARTLAAKKLAMVESRLHSLERMRIALSSLIRQCEAGGARRCAIIDSLSESRR
jgi:MerR family transcriptional regulator, mercuric resistance operon regulatory protein